MPAVSIVTPTYKRHLVVYRCVGCVRLQTMKDWEQVVCSDGVKEELAELVVLGMKDQRVTYRYLGEKKQGDFGNTVRKRMTEEVRGKYVLYLDDDNVIMPTFLEKMVAALEAAPEAGFAVCHILYVYAERWAGPGRNPIVLKGEKIVAGHVDPLQVLVRRDAALKVGWNANGGYNADGDFLNRLGKEFKGARVEEILGVHL